jgi:hypothetical protein
MDKKAAILSLLLVLAVAFALHGLYFGSVTELLGAIVLIMLANSLKNMLT